MKSRRHPKPLRNKAVFATLALLAGACSIQAPNVELVAEGQGGGAGLAPGVVGSALPGQTGTGQQLGGGVAGGGKLGGTGGTTQDAASCTGKATDTGVTGTAIKLGANFAASGPVSNISGPIFKGVMSYFNEVNAQGGVHGRKIQLKWYDDGWDAQKGKGLIKRLVEQDKVFVLSVVPSSNGLDAAKSYLEERRMPVFGTTGLIESQFQSPMQWPVGTSSKSAARIALVGLKQIKAQNLAVIWLDLLAGKQAYDAVVNGVKPIIGKEYKDFVTSAQRVSISEADFGPVWARIKNDTQAWQKRHGQKQDGRPDFVFLLIDPTSAVKALQAAENQGLRPKLGWGGGAPLFLDLVHQGSGYAAATGMQAQTSFYPPIDEVVAKRSAVDEYIKAVRKYYGSSVDLNNPYLEGGYAGAALTVEVLKRVGPCLTREKAIEVANSITDYSAAGLTPPLTFRPPGQGNGHYGNTSILTVQVTKDKKWSVALDWLKDPSPGKD